MTYQNAVTTNGEICTRSSSSRTEFATIYSYDAGAKEITLVDALTTFHYGQEKTYNYVAADLSVIESYTVNLVAEVGLLTRNIKIQGAMTADNVKNEYGATIMLSSPGDETSVGRIEHV